MASQDLLVPDPRSLSPVETRTLRHPARARDEKLSFRHENERSKNEGREATDRAQRWWRGPPTRSPSPTRRRSHSSRPQPPSTPPTSPHSAPSPPARTRTHARSAQRTRPLGLPAPAALSLPVHTPSPASSCASVWPPLCSALPFASVLLRQAGERTVAIGGVEILLLLIPAALATNCA
jgi:hypothetical protein